MGAGQQEAGLLDVDQPPNAIDRLSHLAAKLGAACLLAMVGLGLVNTLARFVGRAIGENLAGNAGLEGQWYLYSLAFLLSLGHTLRRGEHVRVDVLSAKLSPRARTAIELGGGLLLLLPLCAFAIATAAPMVARSIEVWEGSPDPGGLPRWPIKALIPFAFVLLGAQGAAEALRSARALRRAAP
jgi:TRAP-type mannitol/chloroaromatic compound transport system permease small subunit